MLVHQFINYQLIYRIHLGNSLERMFVKEKIKQIKTGPVQKTNKQTKTWKVIGCSLGLSNLK